MGVKSGPATQGKQTHKDKATSALSKFPAYRDPSNREAPPGYHGYGVSQAANIIKKAVGK